MSDAAVTFYAGTEREVTLPLAQALELARLMGEFEAPVWHFNECGCCLSVHERGDGHRGYVIDKRGGSEYVEQGG